MTSPTAAPHRRDTWFHDRTRPWKRALARVVAQCNRALDAFPPCRWAYREQLFRTLEWTGLDLSVGPAQAGLDGTTAVFLSDLHAGSYLGEHELDRLFREVAARQPDLVLFGGDLVHTRRWELDAYARPMQRLSPPLGVFAVPGNHERFRGLSVDAWRRQLEDWGVRVLWNEGVRIERNGASLWLGGIDDLTEGAPDVEAALSGRRPGEPALVLSHHPDMFPELAARGVDLTLSGHTHGGQIAPFGIVPVRHSDHGFHRGSYRRDRGRLYVGCGIGAAILPLRVGARPEVPVVTVRA